MKSLIIKEHSSSKYAPRTYYNAKSSDLTIAFAVDFNTAGERCTHKAAEGKILQLKVYNGITKEDLLEYSRELYRWCKKLNVKSLNVAGNGIYTFQKYGFPQELVDDIVARVITTCHLRGWEIHKIYSGGQTGADIAGARLGWQLGIETEVTLPKGFIQRFNDGIDIEMSEEAIRKQITRIR